MALVDEVLKSSTAADRWPARDRRVHGHHGPCSALVSGRAAERAHGTPVLLNEARDT